MKTTFQMTDEQRGQVDSFFHLPGKCICGNHLGDNRGIFGEPATGHVDHPEIAGKFALYALCDRCMETLRGLLRSLSETSQ